METVTDIIFLGSRITVDGDCIHDIRHVLLRRKAMTNLDSGLKVETSLCWQCPGYSQSYDFSSSHVWMWEVDHKEGWVPKNWCFQTVVLEKTRETPLNIKEINPEYSLEGLMRKLKLQYFGHLIQRADSLEKTLMLGKTEGRKRSGDRRWDGWMVSPTLWTRVWDREAWHATVHGIIKSWTQLHDWTITIRQLQFTT